MIGLRNTVWSCLMVLLVSACYNNNKEQLFPEPLRCNTTAMDYKDSIRLILEGHGCLSCHSDMFPSGGVNLQGYSDVKNAVDNGFLMGAIEHQQGFSAMPPNGVEMSPCDINKLKAWINEGAKNN